MIGDQRAAFDERNTFLYLVLGLISAARVFDELTARYGASRGPAVDLDEPILAFVLGVIACRTRFASILEQLEVHDEPQPIAQPQHVALDILR